MKIIERRITLPNITLNVAFSDNINQPVILLLHGYPDAWFGWEKVMKLLVSKGFRVIAPDQRGYNLSDKPTSISAFANDILVQDALDLMNHFGYQQFFLAGHDFGAYLAFLIGIKAPNRVLKLITISGFHPTTYQNLHRLNFKQRLKSWYLTFFRLPLIPELLLTMKDYRLLFQNHSTQLSASEKQRYKKAWSTENALQSMINWYRSKPTIVKNPMLKMPVLILWGERDLYLSKDVAIKNLSFCKKGELLIITQASHWLLIENSTEVADKMTHFLLSNA